LNLDETGVTREIDLNKVVLMGDEDQLSKVTGMKERFTFTPVITPFGPLESFSPSKILRGQASKWNKAPRKQSELVENPNFDKNKPISEKNLQYHQVFYRDFPDFRYYWNSSAWMTRQILSIELRRLSKFLKKKDPNQRYLLYLD
jgi:hypothetical protein